MLDAHWPTAAEAPALRYLSVCSGIEAATQAWHPLGWQPVAFSEIEPFPCAVLAHHYPNIPNYGDMTRFQEWPDHAVDILCGGTPCQSFSVAGLRKGLADPRGNLMLTFGAIAGRYRPRWLVWENVPGVLSSNGGRDFGAFLGMLGELGYGFAYRVLDAQHVRTRRFPFAVPQRRRRVFVVGYLGDWRRAAAVLFDRESLSGHPAPRREAGQGIAGGAQFRAEANSGDIGYCLTASAQNSLDAETETLIAVAHALRGEGFDAREGGTGRGTPLVPVVGHIPIDMRQASRGATMTNNRKAGTSGGAPGTGIGEAGDPAPTISTSHVPAVAFAQKQRGELRTSEVSPQLTCGGGKPGEGYPAIAFDLNQITSKTNRSQPDPAVHHTLPAASTPPHLATPWAVRRLTPRECERLMGFQDNFTRIPYRNKPADACPDGPRYKALGNSWAVNCAEWIGERIAEVDTWQ